MKKYVIIILSLFTFITNAYALESCTPTDEYLKYISLSEDERKNYIEPIYCKELVEESNVFKDIAQYNALLGETLPSYYNAVDDNIVNVVKNQYDDGTCWAFSALSVFETNAKKNNLPLYNLAEAHMIYSIVGGAYTDASGKIGKYNREINGGRITYSASYLFGDYGVLEENELPYTSPSLSLINSNEYKNGKKLLSVDKFELDGFNKGGACSTKDITSIKSKIINNGSVLGTMNYENKYLHNGLYYMATGGEGDNHGIVIVGWDDSISKNIFGASRNGAWIVKNSWGSNWGNLGYFYVSYDDVFICEQYASYSGVNDTTYAHTYQSADLIGSTVIGFEGSAYIATKIEKKSLNDEVIKKISFASPDLGSYNIYISSIKNISNKNKWKKVGSGSSTSLGIDSITLNEIIESDIYVIIEYSSSRELYILATSSSQEDTSLLTYEQNKNYISFDSTRWLDLAITDPTDPEDYAVEPVIYVYTDEVVYNTSSISCPNVTTSGESFELTLDNPSDIAIKSIIILDGTMDATSDFEITITDIIVINNKNKRVGNFKVIAIDEQDNNFTKDFIIKSSIVFPELYKYFSNNNSVFVPINTSYESVISNITVYNSTYYITDMNSHTVLGGNIGTGYKLYTEDTVYYFVIKGDTNGDTFVDSGDLLRMVKHLKGTINLDNYQLQALELTNDSIIDSGDLLKMVKYLKGIVQLD